MYSSALVRLAASLARDQAPSTSPTAVSTASAASRPWLALTCTEAIEVEHHDAERSQPCRRERSTSTSTRLKEDFGVGNGQRIAGRPGLELAPEIGDLRPGR